MSETRIEGLADLHKALQDLPGKIEGNIMRGALRAGQKVFQQAAQQAVPVDQGDLRKSIKIKFKGRSQKYGWVRMHLQAGDKVAWYAHLIEYGTASYYTGSGKTVGGPYPIKPKKAKGLFFGGQVHAGTIHPGIKPQPFMRPALDGNQAQALEATVEYIKNRLPREIAKLNK